MSGSTWVIKVSESRCFKDISRTPQSQMMNLRSGEEIHCTWEINLCPWVEMISRPYCPGEEWD